MINFIVIFCLDVFKIHVHFVFVTYFNLGYPHFTYSIINVIIYCTEGPNYG